eukprot:CAMPEP_0176488876 /NCGR_PEP_ID=MMETSP0200_2-20121128/6961_1 /TAXON_ID=947934 /ORGANISM="Chaetoceros sp., Strain GSL56" /LENGTH=238 /DNA_ID=CAMNT_0017885925 /DNA_START=217 /DNA_END=933 /DNA_ORIENTATION=+
MSNASSQINKLKHLTSLKNSYFALRHGQSLANVQKIISSDPAISTVDHGLSEVGKEQVTASAKLFTENYYAANQYPQPVAIYSSDFTRARETANLFANTLLDAKIPLYQPPHPVKNAPASGFQLDIRLRERYFGDWNGKSDSHYQDVWHFDCKDANHQEYSCESVNSVVSRTTELIIDIEQELEKYHHPQSFQVILVAHGDVLQILQTAFLKVDGRIHRSLDHLETATVRELVLKTND